jgi:hypothetical protein
MRLTIENPQNIDKHKLPNLDGWSIELGHNYRDMYEFDIFQNHTIRMSLRIMREEQFDSHYDCTMVGSGRATVKYSMNKRHLKTKLGFLMVVSEIVVRMLDAQRKHTQSLKQFSPLQQWGKSQITQSIQFIADSYKNKSVNSINLKVKNANYKEHK